MSHDERLRKDMYVQYETSTKWASLYGQKEVALVRDFGPAVPPPPEGYRYLRRGQDTPVDTDRVSLDTLSWNDQMLEERLLSLHKWQRRPPPSTQRQVDKVNAMMPK